MAQLVMDLADIVALLKDAVILEDHGAPGEMGGKARQACPFRVQMTG
ncbi:MAG: hypothetical protein IJW45_04560 [Oscillospiraceae bacterium]|nr:hypothetical protein [Oscillospiraceae bacterium]